MADKMKLSNNYSDLSTDTAFQFEFGCNCCGTHYRSTAKGYMTGRATQLLGAANSLFGGFLGNVSSVGQTVKDATWKKSHDNAFEEAIEEITPLFIQCPHCHNWVCREQCWNQKKGLCKSCAPDLGVEMAVAQSERSVEEIHAHAAMAEEDKKLATEYWRETIRATCPKCGIPLATHAKFCPECGTKIIADDQCKSCGAKLQPDAKFCPECGTKV
ncbi:MAG TPA: zinc ribbon domain-containing protein [Bacteroidales bacterium]|nr:zinc ribbon domain-containing protein [Bacteroidales bacterium]